MQVTGRQALITAWSVGSVAFALYILRSWWLLPVGGQVTICITVPFGLLLMADLATRRSPFVLRLALAAMAFPCFIFNLIALQRTFNVSPSQYLFLAWAIFALLLAYTYHSRFLLAAGLVCAEIFLAGTFAAWAGLHWAEFPERMETVAGAGLAIIAVPNLGLHGPTRAFTCVYRFTGIVAIWFTVLRLALDGGPTLLPFFWRPVEYFYTTICLTGTTVTIWLGIRRRRRGLVIASTAFLVASLYAGIWARPSVYEAKTVSLILFGMVVAVFSLAFRWTADDRADIRPGGLRWAMVVLLASNAAMLALIGFDRSGEVVQRMTLGEHELPIVAADGTGIRVRLEARLWGGNLRPTEVLVDQITSRFAELGFDDSFVQGYWRDLPARKRFLVAEYKGPAWREWAAKSLQWEPSRLVRVDAGRDPVALRRRYPDRNLYLIIPALMSATTIRDQYSGYEIWTEVLLKEIHVPQPYARVIAERGKRSYKLTLCYGKRYEPWVCDASLE